MMTSPAGAPQKKILVIDGEVELFRMVESSFETNWPGAQVDYVPETATGAQTLRGGRYDLALIDGGMNDNFGLQLAKRALTEKTPVLLISNNPHVVEQLAIAGFPHLAKPFAAEELIKQAAVAMNCVQRDVRRVRASLEIAKARIAALDAGRAPVRKPPEAAEHAAERNNDCGACRTGVTLPPLTMAFQPIVDLAAQKIDAHEALVRGVDGQGAGALFASLSPESLYAFDQTCRVTAIEMAAKLGVACDLHINFMPNAVYEPAACLRQTLTAARRFQFPLDRLVFEVVEDRDVAENGHLANIFSEYRKQNFKLALDDFGTGFSGLSRLADLSPDIVKLDRALIAGCDHLPIRLEIVASVAALCRRLGVKLIAEGVETAGELAALRRIGVNFIQGFYFARPTFQALVPLADIAFSA
jgi:EAL domain-containing protein (putative c-di-GMP-specific phosphodiesterase class I)